LDEEWGLRPDGANPCTHVKNTRKKSETGFLTREELQRLGSVLAGDEVQKTESPFTLAATGG